MALGKSSIVIAIPKHWLRRSRLEKGDTVSVNVQSDGSLSIYPSEYSNEEDKITLLVAENEEKVPLTRRMISCYVNGFSDITLKAEKIFSVEQQEAIREISKMLYLRIMKSSSKEITIQSTLDESIESMALGVERMHSITWSMCLDILESIKNRNKEQAETVMTLENDVDQFAYFLLRLLRMASQNSAIAEKLDLDMLDCLDMYTIIDKIEKIADHIEIIAINVIEMLERHGEGQEGVISILLEAAEMAFNSYEKALNAFLSKDVSKINEIIDNQEDVEELVMLITPLPFSGTIKERQNLCPICSIRESINRISEYAGDIAELTLDRSLRQMT